jgi:hypothetical protein
MPLIVRTAVHRLCATATIRLAPPTAFHLLESIRNPRRELAFLRDRLNQLRVLELLGQSNCRPGPFIQ